MKPKILFVDDEPNILDSLRLTLRPLRSKWDMTFALGGHEALIAFSQTPFDVLVSDMRMPGMDGVQLLSEVLHRYPETIRLILSGYSDEKSVLKTVKLAHQYLSKPCRPVDLIQAIDNALRLRSVLLNSHIKSLIASLVSLPVLPPVYSQLVTALQDENATLEQVANIISQDVAMCASVLRLLNSAFFGLPARVSSIHHAVKLLGSQTLQALVLSSSLFTTLKQNKIPGFSIKLLWEHSFRVACFAKAIGEKEGMKQVDLDDCFIAGILHDVGKLIISTQMRHEFESVLGKVRCQSRALHDVELEVLGTTHAEVGAYLMAIWGFNISSMDAVCWHHCPEQLSCESASPLMAVLAANSFDHELVTIHQDYSVRVLGGSCIVLPELSGRMNEWREVCLNKLKDGVDHG